MQVRPGIWDLDFRCDVSPAGEHVRSLLLIRCQSHGDDVYRTRPLSDMGWNDLAFEWWLRRFWALSRARWLCMHHFRDLAGFIFGHLGRSDKKSMGLVTSPGQFSSLFGHSSIRFSFVLTCRTYIVESLCAG